MAKYKLTKDAVTGEELPFILLGEGAYIPKNIFSLLLRNQRVFFGAF